MLPPPYSETYGEPPSYYPSSLPSFRSFPSRTPSLAGPEPFLTIPLLEECGELIRLLMLAAIYDDWQMTRNSYHCWREIYGMHGGNWLYLLEILGRRLITTPFITYQERVDQLGLSVGDQELLRTREMYNAILDFYYERVFHHYTRNTAWQDSRHLVRERFRSAMDIHKRCGGYLLGNIKLRAKFYSWKFKLFWGIHERRRTISQQSRHAILYE